MAAFALPFDRPRSAILVWPGDEPISPMYGGEVITVPPKDQVATAGRGIYRYGAAQDRSGKPMPGTVLLKDVMSVDPSTAQVVKVFDAEGWVKGLMGVNKKLFERGLTVVVEPDDVAPAMEHGAKLWYQSKLAEWDNEIRTEAARRQKYTAQGQAPPPLDEKGEASLQNAILQLRMNQDRRGSAISDVDLRVALGGPAVVPAPAATPVVPVKAETDEDALSAAAVEMYKLARANKVPLLKEELDGLLARDLTIMAVVEAKLSEAGVEV